MKRYNTYMSIDESRANRHVTLAGTEPYENLLEIKRSEFIGHVKRVSSQEEARAYIESLRKTYHDARHVCSAFIVGADRDVQRSSDDGEPAGTAGIPMLQALLARQSREDGTTDLSDIVAVVVRYFGGIKLGAGGLVRAYTDAVVQTLDAASFVSRERLRVGVIGVSHAQAGRLENDIRTAGLQVLGTEYADQALISVGVFDRPESLKEAEEIITSITSGAGSIVWGGTEWVDIPL